MPPGRIEGPSIRCTFFLVSGPTTLSSSSTRMQSSSSILTWSALNTCERSGSRETPGAGGVTTGGSSGGGGAHAHVRPGAQPPMLQRCAPMMSAMVRSRRGQRSRQRRGVQAAAAGSHGAVQASGQHDVEKYA